MAKPAHTTTMSGTGSPTIDKTDKPGTVPPDSTAGTSREAVKAQERADDDGMAGIARKATAEQAAAAQEAAAARTSEQAERVREAGESFDAGSFAHAASERIADNLSEAAQSIKETDLNQLTHDLSDFARRQPLMFFGGAALLGFAAARMLKASERADSEFDMYAAGGPTAYDRSVS